jgi:hypothetical protein
VQYAKGCNLTASFSETFTQQIVVDGGSFSAPGDSGSLIVTQDTADPVALLFAGSDQNTAGNPVGPILSFFQSGSNAMTFVGGGPHQVIGCTLPARPASTVAVVPVSAVSSDALGRAAAVRAAYASELLKYPEVEALGLAASQDHPGEPAIVFFVRKGSAQPEIPQVVEGVRTRIIEGEWLAERGILSPEQSAALEPTGEPAAMGYAISDSEYTRAKAVHAAHVDAWMSKPGVQGVGIGSSADAPGEAALVIFLVRGVAHEPIPASIDGLRTRVREASPFIAGFADEPKTNACPGPTPRRKQK